MTANHGGGTNSISKALETWNEYKFVQASTYAVAQHVQVKIVLIVKLSI